MSRKAATVSRKSRFLGGSSVSLLASLPPREVVKPIPEGMVTARYKPTSAQPVMETPLCVRPIRKDEK